MNNRSVIERLSTPLGDIIHEEKNQRKDPEICLALAYEAGSILVGFIGSRDTPVLPDFYAGNRHGSESIEDQIARRAWDRLSIEVDDLESTGYVFDPSKHIEIYDKTKPKKPRQFLFTGSVGFKDRYPKVPTYKMSPHEVLDKLNEENEEFEETLSKIDPASYKAFVANSRFNRNLFTIEAIGLMR